MIRTLTVLTLSALLTLALSSGPVRANTTSGVVGTYIAAWNMAGGPAGTDFSAATAFDAYTPTSYFSPPSQLAVLCQGYWAYFVAPTTVPLPSSDGPTQSCPLGAGWNLLGNPFSGQALLPPGTAAYYWNPDRGAYDGVTAIPPGGAVWIYAGSPTVITLIYVPAITRTPTTFELDNLFFTGPYTLHVGDSFKLLLPLATPYDATAEPTYLHLESAGKSGDLTCLGGTACAFSFVNQFWIWHAIAPGATTIDVTSRCAVSDSHCPQVNVRISLNILP